MSQTRPVPVALTIAGSDSGGGAGIQADLKTFTVLGVYGMSVITAITAQNTVQVARAEPLSADLVADQLDAVMWDIGCDAAKTGMLANADIVSVVADGVRRHGISKLVVDPVMVAKSGDALLAERARDALVRDLLPLALVVTPNLHEAGVLTGAEVTSASQMKVAARQIAGLGPKAVVVKGGHLPDNPMDLVYISETQTEMSLEAQRIPTPNTHGTGCTFSAALAARLAQGCDLLDAIVDAKRFISLAITHSLPLGEGHGPTNHLEAGRLMDEGCDCHGGPR